VQQFQAAYDQTVANYRQTVLTAFQQVEDNLAACESFHRLSTSRTPPSVRRQNLLQEATVRYTAGLDPYLNVIAAQTALLNDQQTAVSFRERSKWWHASS
jgi:outer membrane protein TolC